MVDLDLIFEDLERAESGQALSPEQEQARRRQVWEALRVKRLEAHQRDVDAYLASEASALVPEAGEIGQRAAADDRCQEPDAAAFPKFP